MRVDFRRIELVSRHDEARRATDHEAENALEFNGDGGRQLRDTQACNGSQRLLQTVRCNGLESAAWHGVTFNGAPHRSFE